MANRKVQRNDRACKHCGTSPITGYQFCSPRCSRLARRRANGTISIEEYKAGRRAVSVERWSRECVWCGAAFMMLPPNGRANRGGYEAGKYCSCECHGADRTAKAGLGNARARIVGALVRRRDCEHCSRAFLQRHPSQTMCSVDCRQRAAKPIKPRSCHECSQEFVSEYGDKRRRFCSTKCARRTFKRIRRTLTRARRSGVGNEKVDPIRVFERDNWRCQLCRSKTLKGKRGTYHPRAPELDHIVPLASGGHHSYRNTQCACRSCNAAKSDGPGGQLRLVD